MLVNRTASKVPFLSIAEVVELHKRLVEGQTDGNGEPHAVGGSGAVLKSILVKRGETRVGEADTVAQAAWSEWGGAVAFVVQTVELADTPDSVRAAILARPKPR